MNALNVAKRWIGALTEVGLMLIAFGIVAGVLYPGAVPFIGTAVVDNISSLVSSLGGNGLTGIIVLGILYWLARR